MAMYQLRQVRFDEWGNMRPVGKRPCRWVTPERLCPGGVYCLKQRMYRVERVL